MTQAQKKDKEARYDIENEDNDKEFIEGLYKEISTEVKDHTPKHPETAPVRKPVHTEDEEYDPDEGYDEDTDEEELEGDDEENDDEDDDFEDSSVTTNVTESSFPSAGFMGGFLSLVVVAVVGIGVVIPVTKTIFEEHINATGGSGITTMIEPMFNFLPIIVVVMLGLTMLGFVVRRF